jgi:hypothetical protein
MEGSYGFRYNKKYVFRTLSSFVLIILHRQVITLSLSIAVVTNGTLRKVATFLECDANVVVVIVIVIVYPVRSLFSHYRFS